MKKPAISALAIGLFWLLGAQILTGQGVENNTVLLRSGMVLLPANARTFDTKDVLYETEVVGDRFFRLIQFEQVPSAEQHRRLENAGVLLLDYIPHKAYVASLPTSIGSVQLEALGIRSIVPIPQHLKVAQNLKEGGFPDWAMRKGKVEVMLKYYASLPVDEVLAYCRAAGIEILRQNGLNNFLLAAIDPEKIEATGRLPFVSYLELGPAPGEPEDIPGRGLHRANAIDVEFPSGRHYSGQDVNTLVRDDGFVGPHIDFKNRLVQGVSGDGGINHADQVSSVVGGAGNLDPKAKGMASGAQIYTLNYVADFLDNTLSLHVDEGVLVTNTSYSQGCNDGYTATSQTVDQQLHDYPTFLHVFSAGNAGAQNCQYGAGNGWGNITGGHKQSKNAVAVAATAADGQLANFSSRGPATDGRLKPDISAFGQDVQLTLPGNEYAFNDGTSFSAPAITGVFAQLHQAYSESNPGQIAESALLKAIMLNTANDAGNEGPDFKFGWGLVNAYRAALAIEEGRYFEGTIDQAGVNTHQISIPAGVKQAKIMVCWNDKEGSEMALKALVADLDMELDNGGPLWKPLILNTAPSAALLDLPAAAGTDTLNNVEQISLADPAAGAYTLTLTGTEVPFPGQKYWVTYDYIYDEITLTYPFGGEGFAPGESEYIHWDAAGSQGEFLVEYSTDGGSSWTSAATLSGNARLYSWTVPDVVTGKAFVRVTRDGVSGQNQLPFSIVQVPANLLIGQACPGFIRLEWDAVPGALAYDVFLLGEYYMDSIGTTAELFFEAPAINNNPTLDHWFSVRAVGGDGLRGRRAIAVPWDQGLLNCPLQTDLAITKILSPNNALSLCGSSSTEVTVEVWNNGLTDQSDPEISYQLDGQAPVSETYAGTIFSGDTVTVSLSEPLDIPGSGAYELKAWIHATAAADEAGFNDTLTKPISAVLYPGVGAPTGIVETFEANFPPDYWQILNVDDSYTYEVKEVTGIDGLTTTAVWINNYDYPDVGAEDDLITLPYDLGSATEDTKLTFDLSYSVWDTSVYWDALRLDVYTDCGNTFAGTVYYKANLALATVPPQTSPFTPSDSTHWRKEAVDLGEFAGESLVVHFVNITGYGNNLYIDNVNVDHITLPEAGILASDTEICQGEAVQFSDNSQGNGLTYQWDFGTGAVPPGADGPGPHDVNYVEPGSQTATLIIYDGDFYDTAYQIIEVIPLPVAGFGYADLNGVVTFANNSIYGISFSWDFGDGNTSDVFNPVHTYQNSGTYTVTLTVTNACGSVELSQEVLVVITAVNDVARVETVRILPNPSKGRFEVVLENFPGQSVELRVLDLTGRLLWSSEGEMNGPFRQAVDLGDSPGGLYELVIRTDSVLKTFKLVIQ